MNKITISILTAVILSAMVFLPETVSAEFIAISSPGIFAGAVFTNVSGEKGSILSAGDLFNSIDLKIDASRTIEQARFCMDSLKMV